MKKVEYVIIYPVDGETVYSDKTYANPTDAYIPAMNCGGRVLKRTIIEETVDFAKIKKDLIAERDRIDRQIGMFDYNNSNTITIKNIANTKDMSTMNEGG